MTDEQKRPFVTAGAFIFNKEGKIFMMRSPKWGNRLVGPGGHIEYGETVSEALKREVKEETNLEITDIEFFTTTELIDSKEFIKREKHFIVLDCFAKLTEDNQEVILSEEGLEYFWLTPDEIFKRDDMESTTVDVLKRFLAKKEKPDQVEEYKKDWQRALADYKNLQKETSERRSEWAQMSKANILEDFIPVYDNFKSAFFHHPILQADNEEHKQMKNWIDGIGYIMKQFGDVMKNHGIEEIKTVGEKFDPNLHESMGEEEAEGKEAGIILKELVGGYKMGNNVIKAAKVVIAK